MMATLQAVIDLACGDQVAEVELTIALDVEVIGHTPREHGGREHPDVPEEFELEATLAADVTALGGAVTIWRAGEIYELDADEHQKIAQELRDGR